MIYSPAHTHLWDVAGGQILLLGCVCQVLELQDPTGMQRLQTIDYYPTLRVSFALVVYALPPAIPNIGDENQHLISLCLSRGCVPRSRSRLFTF